MRWVFIALVLANVGLFFWRSVESSRMERLEALNTTSDNDRGVVAGAPLILVSELTEQEKQDLMKPKETPSIKEAGEASVAVAPVTKDKPVSDIPVASSPAVTTQNTRQAVETNQCLRIGPLLNAAEAEQVSQRLMAVAIIADMIGVDVPGKPEYWVILPPFNDEKTALQKLQELQGRAIQGQIISKGEMANAISFGLHGQRDDANKQAEELNIKGYKAQVRAVPVINKEKWLALSERQAPKLTDELWQEIHKDFPKLNKQVKTCH